MANGRPGSVILEAVEAAEMIGRPAAAPGVRGGLCRVSVRTLLVLILIIGCALGWIAQVRRTGQIQRRAVAAIYQAGGWVVYDTEWEQRQDKAAWKPRWPKWLVDWLGADYFGNVVFINLHDRGNDQVLAHVARLTHLRQLHRPGFAVTDAGLNHIRRLRDLQLLSLEGTQVSDAGLAHLRGLASLRWLKIGRTGVTDTGVAKLQKFLPQLQAIR